MTKFFFKLAIIFFFVIASKISLSQEITKNFEYKIEFSDVDIAKINLSIRENNAFVELSAKTVTTGLSNVFYDYESILTANLFKKNNNWKSLNLKVESEWNGKKN